MAKYELWQIEAQTSAIGLHDEANRAGAVRDVVWSHEDPRMLFDELKGSPITGLFL